MPLKKPEEMDLCAGVCLMCRAWGSILESGGAAAPVFSLLSDVPTTPANGQPSSSIVDCNNSAEHHQGSKGDVREDVCRKTTASGKGKGYATSSSAVTAPATSPTVLPGEGFVRHTSVEQVLVCYSCLQALFLSV